MVLVAEKIRNLLFWILDFLKGGKVRKHFSNVVQINTDYPAAKEKVTKQLSSVLAHAANTTAFYGKYKNTAISNFPVINKNIVRENEDLFISSAFEKSTLSKTVTSGSTGTPFCVYHNADKKIRNTADTIYFARLAGYELGQKLYYFKIWNEINSKTGFTAWAQNIEACNVFELSDAAIAKFLNVLNEDRSTIGFLGYASAYDAICSFLDKNPSFEVKANVRSAIGMSEALSDYTKEAMQRHFRCKCVSRYSNVENGMIAQQPLDGNEFHINFASYYVEILNLENDDACSLGKAGRIVVTDLYNVGMPMIRYDTGDIGVMNEKIKNGKKIPVLEKIEGRKMDMVFNSDGDLVSSFTITNGMWKYTELKQYQFIQNGKSEYQFKLNCDTPFEREAELIADFQKFFGQNSTIAVEYVSEIPLLNSGKRKKVMNIYGNSK
jgi:phenylacetate-CoA ligase